MKWKLWWRHRSSVMLRCSCGRHAIRRCVTITRVTRNIALHRTAVHTRRLRRMQHVERAVRMTLRCGSRVRADTTRRVLLLLLLLARRHRSRSIPSRCSMVHRRHIGKRRSSCCSGWSRRGGMMITRERVVAVTTRQEEFTGRGTTTKWQTLGLGAEVRGVVL